MTGFAINTSSTEIRRLVTSTAVLITCSFTREGSIVFENISSTFLSIALTPYQLTLPLDGGMAEEEHFDRN
jgi:hypothetical protein